MSGRTCRVESPSLSFSFVVRAIPASRDRLWKLTKKIERYVKAYNGCGTAINGLKEQGMYKPVIRSFDRFLEEFNQLHYWSGDGIKAIHVTNAIKDNLFQSGAAYKKDTAEEFHNEVLKLKQTYHDAENAMAAQTAKKPAPIEHKEQPKRSTPPEAHGMSWPKQFYQ